jgi:hypothetical protein
VINHCFCCFFSLLFLIFLRVFFKVFKFFCFVLASFISHNSQSYSSPSAPRSTEIIQTEMTKFNNVMIRQRPDLSSTCCPQAWELLCIGNTTRLMRSRLSHWPRRRHPWACSDRLFVGRSVPGLGPATAWYVIQI